MTATNYDIIAAGHICLDIIPKIPDKGEFDVGSILKPGKLLKVNDAVISTGGAVSNTGIALSKLGCKTGFISSIGNDEFGDIIMKKMSEYGDVSGFHRNGEVGSSYSVILAIPNIDRIILHSSGCNNFFNEYDINWDVVASARHFHLGYPSIMKTLFRDDGKELVKILKRVKALKISTSLDMAQTDPNSEAGQIDWRKWSENVLPYVDFFLPSIEEMLFFLERAQWEQYRDMDMDFVDAVPLISFSEIAQKLLDFGCGVIMLKAGDRGIYLKSSGGGRISKISLIKHDKLASWVERELWGASYKVEKIESAIGAGDSAVAGVLTALLNDESPEQTLRWGNCLGYQNLRALDTVSGVGTHQETIELLQKLTSIPIDFLDEGWQLTSGKDIWARN